MFLDQDALNGELERVFDICHGCRRCVSLCDSFPTLFDLIDESDTLEVDGVDKNDYQKVSDQCFLCDLCAETKCPYLPPHEWAVDFPHLMLRAKAYKFSKGKTKWRDKIITSTSKTFRAINTPGIRQASNALANNKIARKAGELFFGIHSEAPIPKFQKKPVDFQLKESLIPIASEKTRGKVAIFSTCYGENNEPVIIEDMLAVFEHNSIKVKIINDATCCGMPKLELGDLVGVEDLKNSNLPILNDLVNDGYDIITPIPSCTLMFKQELPLMFPEDNDVNFLKPACFDPFEYLILRHKEGLIKTNFKHSLGKVAYHVACHQRVQNIGAKTKEFLGLIPDTEIEAIERCSGHDGTYAIKKETYNKAKKISRPVVNKVKQIEPDSFGSDCPMAGRMIAHGIDEGEAEHPISMVRRAYGI